MGPEPCTGFFTWRRSRFWHQFSAAFGHAWSTCIESCSPEPQNARVDLTWSCNSCDVTAWNEFSQVNYPFWISKIAEQRDAESTVVQTYGMVSWCHHDVWFFNIRAIPFCKVRQESIFVHGSTLYHSKTTVSVCEVDAWMHVDYVLQIDCSTLNRASSTCNDGVDSRSLWVILVVSSWRWPSMRFVGSIAKTLQGGQGLGIL